MMLPKSVVDQLSDIIEYGGGYGYQSYIYRDWSFAVDDGDGCLFTWPRKCIVLDENNKIITTADNCLWPWTEKDEKKLVMLIRTIYEQIRDRMIELTKLQMERAINAL